MGIDVKFWGVRGSVSCCSPEYSIYGGNTSCVELNFDGNVVIIDAGTGLLALGKDLCRRKINQLSLLISHAHWDHINGFPFFLPAYRKDVDIDIYACPLPNGESIQKAFSTQMSAPFFPLPMSEMPADINFYDIESGDTFKICDNLVHVKTLPLNHPNGATGFRFEYKGKVIAYISDTEHFKNKFDDNVITLAKDADLMIYDAMYTEDEYNSFTGWGHSTQEEAVNVSIAANVKRTAMFHHSPEHTDAIMREIERNIIVENPSVFAAKEGMLLHI